MNARCALCLTYTECRTMNAKGWKQPRRLCQVCRCTLTDAVHSDSPFIVLVRDDWE